MIYLDYTAHTPVSENVLETFCRLEREYIGNANSSHPAGVSTKNKFDQITAQIRQLTGVTDKEVIYTSGATEANNLAIKGIVQANRHIGRHIIATSLEHTSVSASLSYLQMMGYEIDLCPMDAAGRIDLEELEDLLREDTVMVCMSAVDSEIGIVQPVKEAEAIIRQYSQCHLHIDATQAVGKIPFDFSVGDTISFAPHKFYGLNGSGILLKQRNVRLTPQMSGGTSTTIYRSGTPALGLAGAIVPALQDAVTLQEERYNIVKSINDDLQNYFSTFQNVEINSTKDAVPHILNIGVKGIKGPQMQQLLSEKDICVSVKSACSSDLLPSKAVMALTHNKKRAYESFRISLSHLTTKEEINTFKHAFREILESQGVV